MSLIPSNLVCQSSLFAIFLSKICKVYFYKMVFQAFVWSVCICFCLSLYVCVQMFVSVHKSVCLHVHGNVCTLNLCWVTTKMSLPWCPTPKCPETVMSLSFLSPTKMSLFMSLSFGHGGHWSFTFLEEKMKKYFVTPVIGHYSHVVKMSFSKMSPSTKIHLNSILLFLCFLIIVSWPASPLMIKSNPAWQLQNKGCWSL